MKIPFFIRVTFAVLIFGILGEAVFGQDPKEAASEFGYGNYFGAIDMYSKLIKKEPDNSAYNENLGLSYLRTNIDPKVALDYLLKVESLGKFKSDLYLEIARAYMFHLQYEEALNYVEKFEKNGGVNKKNTDDYTRLKTNCIAAMDLLKYPVSVHFKNLGSSINTEYPDYYPFITKDGQTLIFTSRRKVRPGSSPEFDGYYPSDIFETHFKNAEWETAQRLGDRINTVYDEQSVGLTDTGDTLFFYIDHVDDFGDLFTSVSRNGIFADPQRMDNQINSASVESACTISKNGQTMLFSSNREGGAGGLDLWTVRKRPNGKWDKPVNLGEEINTSFNEDFPTLSADGQTLYFCSDGHPGMGGYDLFFSCWDEQSHIWSKPQNLGYPINTPNDEKTISYLADGKSAVMSAFRADGFGDLDIYTVTYQKKEDDNPAIFVFSIPLNDGEISPEIEIRNEFDEPVGNYYANRVTGRYIIGLYPGKYFIYIDAKGYKPYNEALVVNRFHTRQDNNVKVIKLEK